MPPGGNSDEVVIKARGEGFDELRQKMHALTDEALAFSNIINRSQNTAPVSSLPPLASDGGDYPSQRQAPPLAPFYASPTGAQGGTYAPPETLLLDRGDTGRPALPFAPPPSVQQPRENPTHLDLPLPPAYGSGGQATINATNVVINSPSAPSSAAPGQSGAPSPSNPTGAAPMPSAVQSEQVAESIAEKVTVDQQGRARGSDGRFTKRPTGAPDVDQAAPASAPDPMDSKPQTSPNEAHEFFPGASGISLNPFNSASWKSPGFSNFLKGVAANPTPMGAINALGNSVPMVPAAILTAGLAGIGYVGDVSMAGQRPGFQNQTQLLAAQAAGQFIGSGSIAGMSHAADLQGNLDAQRATWSPLFMIPGVRNAWEMAYGQDQERAIALAQAGGSAMDIRLRFGASGARALTGGPDEHLQGRAASLGQTSVFGRAAVDTLGVDSDYAKARAYGFTDDDTNGARSTILSIASQPQYAAMYAALARGEKAGTLKDQAAQSLIFNGDLSGMASLLPFYKEAGQQAQYDSVLAQTQMMRQSMQQIQMNQTSVAMAGTAISGMGYTGASIASQAVAIRKSAGLYDPVISELRARMAAAPTDYDRQQVAQQIQQQQVSQEQTIYQGQETAFQSQQVTAGAANTNAGVDFQRAMYLGDGSVYGAFDARGSAMAQNVAIDRARSLNPLYSPEVRAQWAAQTRADQTQIDVGLRRERGQYYVGLTQSAINVQGAQVGADITQAGLTGGPLAQYNAQMEQIGVMQRTQALNQEQIDDPKRFGLSKQEVNALQAQNIDLIKQENQIRTESVRTMLAMNTAIAQTSLGMVQTSNSQAMQFFGVGGQAVAPMAAAAATAAGVTYQDSVAQLMNLQKQGVDPNSIVYKQQQAAVQQAWGQRMAQDDSLAQAPGTLATRNTLLQGSTAMNVLTQTFGSYGDVRGVTKAMMDATGTQLQDVRANQRNVDSQVQAESAARKDANGNPLPFTAQEMNDRKGQLNYEYNQQASTLTGQLVGEQTQLENGWMGRLISMTSGMPSRGAYVATQFTNREASRFNKYLTSAFGFSGSGATAARDYYMTRGDRLASSIIGNVSRPQGFDDTAMSMGNNIPHPDTWDANNPATTHPIVSVAPGSAPGPVAPGTGTGYGSGAMNMMPSLAQWAALGPHAFAQHVANAHSGGVLRSPASLQSSAGVLTINVVLHNNQVGNVVGRGSAKTTIHDLNNGSIEVTGSQYNSKTAHY